MGAARAGFDVRVAVELDPVALSTHARNFPGTEHLQLDVAQFTGKQLLAAARVAGSVGIDGLIGGPPCQGFSAMGKRQVDDERNGMFNHFFRLIAETRPRFFLIENVPGILADRNRALLDAAYENLPSNYIVVAPRRVAASEFGLATTRERVFFIGYDPDRCDVINEDILFAATGEKTTVGQALFGLPAVRSDWQEESQGWRVVAAPQGGTQFIDRIIGSIPAGIGCKDSLVRYQSEGVVSGNLGTRHKESVKARFRRLREGQVDSTSKAPKLSRDGLCPTLRAGTGPDRGSFQSLRPIHFNSPRVITPREAARLQGFPDWFQFHATKWHSFRQIGNSVSPVVAELLLSRMIAQLGMK